MVDWMVSRLDGWQAEWLAGWMDGRLDGGQTELWTD